jgi:hypothetical protein
MEIYFNKKFRFSGCYKINKINSYDLTLFNQIKGDGKDFTKDKRILKVFNPNQKK